MRRNTPRPRGPLSIACVHDMLDGGRFSSCRSDRATLTNGNALDCEDGGRALLHFSTAYAYSFTRPGSSRQLRLPRTEDETRVCSSSRWRVALWNIRRTSTCTGHIYNANAHIVMDATPLHVTSSQRHPGSASSAAEALASVVWLPLVDRADRGPAFVCCFISCPVPLTPISLPLVCPRLLISSSPCPSLPTRTR